MLKKYLLQRLAARQQESGFTLIEILTVLIIVGILAAIALPSFLNQSNKARLAEAENYVGATTRAQTAFYLEQNRFAETVAELRLGLPTETESYLYNLTTEPLQSLYTATPTAASLPGVAGKAFIQSGVGSSIVCRGAAGQIPAIAAAGVTTCPTLPTP